MDWGTMLGNLAGYSMAGNQMRQDQQKNYWDELKKQNDANSYVPGNVALGFMLNLDPDDPALAQWKNVVVPMQYLGQTGAYGYDTSRSRTLEATRPFDVEEAKGNATKATNEGAISGVNLDVARNTSQYKIDEAGSNAAEAKSNAEEADYNAKTAGEKFTQTQNETEISKATKDAKITAVQKELNKLDAEIAGINARTDMTNEEKQTEIDLRQGKKDLLRAQIGAENALTNQRNADANKTTNPKTPSGLTPGDAIKLIDQARNAYNTAYGSAKDRAVYGKFTNGPPPPDLTTYIVGTYLPNTLGISKQEAQGILNSALAGGYKMPTPAPVGAGGASKAVQLLNTDPQAWVEQAIKAAPASNGKTGSLRGAVDLVRNTYQKLLDGGANQNALVTALTILKGRVVSWNKSHPNSQIQWPKELP